MKKFLLYLWLLPLTLHAQTYNRVWTNQIMAKTNEFVEIMSPFRYTLGMDSGLFDSNTLIPKWYLMYQLSKVGVSFPLSLDNGYFQLNEGEGSTFFNYSRNGIRMGASSEDYLNISGTGIDFYLPPKYSSDFGISYTDRTIPDWGNVNLAIQSALSTSGSKWTSTPNGISYAGSIFPGAIKKWEAVTDTGISMSRINTAKIGHYIKVNNGYGYLIATNTQIGFEVAQNNLNASAYYINVNNGIGLDILNNMQGATAVRFSNAGTGIDANNVGSGDAIKINNTASGRAIHIDNAANGRGINLTNTAYGYGIYVLNTNLGYGSYYQNNSGGRAIYIVNSASGNGIGVDVYNYNESATSISLSGVGKHIRSNLYNGDTTEVFIQSSSGINQVFKKNSTTVWRVDGNGVLMQAQLTCDLTDNTPSQAELVTCLGSASAPGAGTMRNIKDSSDNSIYQVLSNGSNWGYVKFTIP